MTWERYTDLSEVRETSGKLASYAWPGGYPIGYLADDGEVFCADCANGESAECHQRAEDKGDGWYIIGWEVFEGSAEDYDSPVSCAHCGAILVGEDD